MSCLILKQIQRNPLSKEPLPGTGEVSGDVVEGQNFLQIVVDGHCPNGLPPFGFCCIFSIASFRSLWMEYVTLKTLD